MGESRKARILLVDDNPQNLQFLGEVLEKAGYDIGVAMDGQEALETMRLEVPELVLLDILMPQMNGFEVCQQMKQDPVLSAIPVIFLSAKAEKEDIIKAFEIGGMDYVTKPFNSTELLARVHTHLALSQAYKTLEQKTLELTEANQALKKAKEQAEAANWHIRKQEKRLLQILDMTQEAIIACSFEGTITYVNHPAEQLLGHSSQAMISSPFYEIFPEWRQHPVIKNMMPPQTSMDAFFKTPSTYEHVLPQIPNVLLPLQQDGHLQEVKANLFLLESEDQHGVVFCFTPDPSIASREGKINGNGSWEASSPVSVPEERIHRLEQILQNLPLILSQSNQYLLNELKTPQPISNEAQALSRETKDKNGDQEFYQALVNLMVISLQYWERTTQKTKFAFAEESGIWNFYLDNRGVFRTRTLDRYLKLKTIPQKPRWRDVLQSGYYVLKHCPEEPALKTELENAIAHLEKLLQDHI